MRELLAFVGMLEPKKGRPRKPSIYLACPYSHSSPDVARERVEKATLAAGDLMARGHIVYSPITHYHEIAKLGELPDGWEYWREPSFFFLDHMELLAVLCLPGWRESIGVQAEIRRAQETGKETVYIKIAGGMILISKEELD